MFSKPLFIVASMLSLATSSAHTQEALTLDGAIKLALAENPALAAAAQDAEAAKIAVRGAGTLVNPELLLTPALPRGSVGSDGEFLFVQPLELNGVRRARTRIASGEAEAAKATVEAARRELIRDVKIAYWQVAEAQAVAELNRENVKLVELLFAAAKRQVEIGSAPGSHAIKAEVELARARQELTRAEAELEQARTALNIIIGRDPKTYVIATDRLGFEPMALPVDGSDAQAIENRPEITQAKALLSARRAEVDAARALRRPDLAVQARKEALNGDTGLGIGISLPIFDWGLRKAHERQAETAVSAQEKRVESEMNRVRLDVQVAVIAVRAAEAQVREYESGVVAKSEQLAQMAEKGYESGAAGYLEVLEAQRTLRAVKTEYITALFDHAIAKAELEWAVAGELSEMEAKK